MSICHRILPSKMALRWPMSASLIAFVMYYATVARGVTLVDSGELILACQSLGIAHPPGFPLYLLIGHLFSHLPLGETAFRLGLMSAFFAALLAAFGALILGEIGSQRIPDLGRATLGWCQLTTALTLAFSSTVWAWATVAEVYTLNLSLLAGSVWALLRWRRFREREYSGASYLVLASLLYGLALGVHHLSGLLMLPAIIWWLGRWGRTLRTLRLVPMASILGAAVVGLSSYLYLPWRASHRPLLNWGNPQSFDNFLNHVGARQYRTHLVSGSWQQVGENLSYFATQMVNQFTLLGTVFALFGIIWLWRRDRTWLGFSSLVILFALGYSANYNIAEDRSAYGLTTTLMVSTWVGSGLLGLVEFSSRRRRILLGFVGGALVLANVAAHFKANDHRRDQIARHFVEDTLEGIAEGGLLLTLDWQFYSPFWYLHHGQGYRPDVTVIDVNLARKSWYLSEYLARIYPETVHSSRTEMQLYISLLKRWEHGEDVDPSELTRSFSEFINSLIEQHRGEVHFTVPMEPGVGAGYAWIPHGLTMKRVADPSRYEPSPRLHIEPLLGGGVAEHEAVRSKLRPHYARMLGNRAFFLQGLGQFDEALDLVDQSLRLQPMAQTFKLRGDIEYRTGQFWEARSSWEAALILQPDFEEARTALGHLDEKPSEKSPRH